MRVAAFEYLKLQQSKQDKIKNIEYQKFEMQGYLADGDRNTNLSKVIFKARGRNLDIKLQKKWKYDDILCSGCKTNEESGEEVLNCKSFGENKEKVSYSMFFSDLVKEQTKVGNKMMKNLKERKRIREEVT